MSYEGILELVAVPAGLLMIAGLFTRQVGLVLAVMYLTLFFVGPLQRGPFTHRNGGDPVLLNAFFFLYLSASGGGAWSVDRLRGRESVDDRWAHTTLGRPPNRCRLLVRHARPREVLWCGRRTHRPRHHDHARPCRMARIIRWTAHHHRALHATGRVHPVWRDGSGLLQVVGAERLLAKLYAAGDGSVDPVLLSVPVPVGCRARCLEPRGSVAPPNAKGRAREAAPRDDRQPVR